MSKYDELERLLAEATPGPWEAYDAARGADTEAWGVATAHRALDSFEVTVVGEDFVSKRDARLIAAMRNALPDLLAEWRELLIKARVAGELVRFRETPDLAKEVDEATEEGLDMDHANLASHYACAIANWNVTLDARDEAQGRVAELEEERRELLAKVDALTAELTDLRDNGPLLGRTMTVRDLLDALGRFVGNETVSYDTGERPDGIDSWRGIYDELALGHTDGGVTTVDELRGWLQSAIGKTFTGYKGGKFTMSEDTPVWVDNYGEYTADRMIVGVRESGADVVLVTRLEDEA